MGNKDVRVSPGVDILTTKNRKEEAVKVLVEQGLIEEPRQALEMFGVKTVEEYYEDEFIDERQAQRQLEEMKTKDEYIKPNEDDNHDVMFKTFNNARKSAEFESLPKKRQDNILKRIEEEKLMLNTPAQAPEGAEVVGEEEVPVEGAAGAIAPVGAALPPVPGAAAGGANQPASPEEILMAIAQAQGGAV